MKSQLEGYILDVIEERKPAPLIKGALSLFSYFFQGAVALRNWGYERGIIKSMRASLPVVSIGNIAAGGTGKTPLIHLLASQLAGDQVAILTRGYRGKIKGDPLNIAEACELDVKTFGDEPSWLCQKLPRTAVWVGKNRIKSAELAAQAKAQILLLDDGMQYRALARDVEIVILDGQDLFAKKAFLPRGLLRDHPKRLKDADLIVINHVYDQAHYQTCIKELASYTDASIAAMRYRFKDADYLKGKSVGVFCALGRPERFLDALRRAGCNIVEDLLSVDHLPFGERQLQAFAQRCKAKGAELLVCTEKDGIKLASFSDFVLPIKSLGVEIEWTAGEDKWNACIKYIKGMIDK